MQGLRLTPPMPATALQPPVPGQFLGNKPSFSYNVVSNANASLATGQQFQLTTVILMACSLEVICMFLILYVIGFIILVFITIVLFRLQIKLTCKVEGLPNQLLLHHCNLRFQGNLFALLLMFLELLHQVVQHQCGCHCQFQQYVLFISLASIVKNNFIN